MVGVGGGATAEQADAGALFGAGHQKQRGGFPDVDAMAVGRKRVAALVGYRLQAGKTVQGQLAQAVHAAAQHRIAQAHAQQALGGEQGAAAGGTGSGLAVRRAAEAQPVGEEAGGCGDLLTAVAVSLWQLAAVHIFGDMLASLGDARCAGAEYYGDAAGAVSGDGGLDVVMDLQGSGQQQAVVAAGRLLEAGGHFRQRCIHRANGHAALGNPARLPLHAVSAAGEQCLGHCLLALAQGADHAQGGESSDHGCVSSGRTRYCCVALPSSMACPAA